MCLGFILWGIKCHCRNTNFFDRRPLSAAEGKRKDMAIPLQDTAISLKKGNFNTPSEIPFFEKENGGFELCFKTAACDKPKHDQR